VAQAARAQGPIPRNSLLLRPPQRSYSNGQQEQEYARRARLAILTSLFGGAVAFAHLKAGQDPAKHLRQKIESLLPTSALTTAECAGSGFSDKNLDDFTDKLGDGIDKLVAENPRIQKVKLVSGLRGTRYFVEFPIAARNFDAYSLLQKVQKKLEKGKGKKHDVRVTQTDSYLKDEQVAYLVDYSVRSSQVEGTRCPGSLYIRGVKGQDGLDSFKFTLEKGQDFSDFDV